MNVYVLLVFRRRLSVGVYVLVVFRRRLSVGSTNCSSYSFLCFKNEECFTFLKQADVYGFNRSFTFIGRFDKLFSRRFVFLERGMFMY